MNTSRIPRLQVLFLASFMGVLLAACGRMGPVSTPEMQASTTATSAPTPSALPSATPTQPAPLSVLLAPAEADAQLVSGLQAAMSDLAAESGLRFQLRQQLSPSDLDGDVQIVVSLPPDPGLAQLAADAPGVQFVALDIPGLAPAQNLSLVGGQGQDAGAKGFLAGYIAAAITTDWRVGVISLADDPRGQAARLGFGNGVVYFCGLCRPVYPPFPNTGYPLSAELPAQAGQADWDSALTYFKTWQVGTVYLYPAVADDQLLAELAENGINLIGQGSPPSGLRDHWAATIQRQDPVQPLVELWPSLVNGEGGVEIELALTFSEANENLFSAGKQRLVKEMLEDLNSGYIDPGVDGSAE
jgi:hypothetical protein